MLGSLLKQTVSGTERILGGDSRPSRSRKRPLVDADGNLYQQCAVLVLARPN